MNSMFNLHWTAPRHAMHSAPEVPVPRVAEMPKPLALDRWENEGGKILPFPSSPARPRSIHSVPAAAPS